jgi:hypothetical protein
MIHCNSNQKVLSISFNACGADLVIFKACILFMKKKKEKDNQISAKYGMTEFFFLLLHFRLL